MGCGKCVNEVGVKDVLLNGFGSPGIDKILYRSISWREEMQDVKVGQVWSDKDKRRIGRTIIVNKIDGGRAVCQIVTSGMSKGKKSVKIKIDRFQPKYYVLRDSISMPNVAPPLTVVQSPVVAEADKVLTLVEHCKNEWFADWKKIDQHTAGIDSGNVSVRVRKVNDECFDVKMLVNSRWVFSSAIKEDLHGALDKLCNVVFGLTTDLQNLS